MTRLLQAWSDVDPRELQINRRFKGSHHVHPRARKAQRQLADDIRAAIPPDYQPGRNDCAVTAYFRYPNRKSDVDGPVKRVLDALEMAVKGSGHAWHDGRINDLRITRKLIDPAQPNLPLIGISMLC